MPWPIAVVLMLLFLAYEAYTPQLCAASPAPTWTPQLTTYTLKDSEAAVEPPHQRGVNRSRTAEILEARYRLRRVSVGRGFKCYNKLDGKTYTAGYFDSGLQTINLSAGTSTTVFSLDEAPGWAVLAAAKGIK